MLADKLMLVRSTSIGTKGSRSRQSRGVLAQSPSNLDNFDISQHGACIPTKSPEMFC